VRPGESLWLIAEQMLGERANDAQVAAEVQRLWQLNADRIGTGNPDLVYAGQELRTR
jgi:nucleoid-associated protein YgaU